MSRIRSPARFHCTVSVLPLLAPGNNDVNEGDVVQVTGTVERNDADENTVKQYQLAEKPGIYGAYGGEDYVAASSIKPKTE